MKFNENVQNVVSALRQIRIVPVLVLGIPIFDTLLAIIRRLLSGKPIMSPDKEHLHHHLIYIHFIY